ncbi:MAG TPA: YidC/Oxa1 family insertase periplasmic-domain containing protein, partial [Rhodothermales bacterium]
MDRNVVTATILIAIIMFAWLWWLAPEPREPVGDRPEPVDTIAVSPSDPDTSLPQSDLQVRATPADTALAGASEGTARLITVVSDLYKATFSTKGATLVSMEMREYTQFDQTTPVQIVSENARGALGLAFTTPSNHNVDSRDLYF